MTPTENKPEKERGKVYWFLRNSIRPAWHFACRHFVKLCVLFLVSLLVLFWLRAALHPFVIILRRHAFVVIVLAPLFVLLWWQLRKGTWTRKLLTAGIGAAALLFLAFYGVSLHNYCSLHYRYKTLHVAELDELPTTDFERIQPLNSIYSLAHEVMTDTEAPMAPDFVRVGDEYRWTLAIEPAYPIPRVMGNVKEILSVSGTAPSPNFSNQNRIPVQFEVGEQLKFGRNSNVGVIRAFSWWRYFNCEPAGVSYIKDDQGEWVQIVSLISWKGVMFPRPEFGGVYLIRQHPGGLLADLKRAVVGVGTLIAPGEIADHAFLRGENILPFQVSRYVANSFRFQEGFTGPLPGYHRGDIRIPDLSADENMQPFTCYFDGVPGQVGMLYHYFAMEPFDPSKQGLNTSLFLPADGSPTVYVYRHHAKRGSLSGVSAISAKVMESKKNYDWSRNRPVEHRPYIKFMGGEKRFFWLTTVVTFKDEQGGKRFIAGSIPDIILTDAAYNTPVWVDPFSPDKWQGQIEEALGEVWSTR